MPGEIRSLSLLLADDLSGALEAGAAWSSAGQRVILPLHSSTFFALPSDSAADTVVLNTETRNEEGSRAALRLAALPALTRERRPVYWKVDSTLRGPVGHQMAALAEIYPDLVFLVAPANPAAGRTMRDGNLFVNGIPVAESAFAADPRSPVTTSNVSQWLRDGLGQLAIGHLPLKTLRDGMESAQQAIGESAKSGVRVIAADAETHEDLARLAEVAEVLEAAAEIPLLPVGSGGLANAIVRRFPKQAPANRVPVSVSGGRLYVVGSAHPIAQRQAQMLTAQHSIPLLSAVPVHIPEARRALETTGAAILITEQPTPDLAETVRSIVDATPLAALYITGGETASQILHALPIKRLRILGGEQEPGLVLAQTEGGNIPLIAVKPGGFGDAETLIRLDTLLRKREV
jgi:uncharacterized protein YgbK (DUF1537 family)